MKTASEMTYIVSGGALNSLLKPNLDPPLYQRHCRHGRSGYCCRIADITPATASFPEKVWRLTKKERRRRSALTFFPYITLSAGLSSVGKGTSYHVSKCSLPEPGLITSRIGPIANSSQTLNLLNSICGLPFGCLVY